MEVNFAVTAVLMVAVGAAPVTQRQLIATSYEAGHFFATVEVPQKGALKLVIDTGGPGGSGLYVLSGQSISRLGLKTLPCDLGGEVDQLVAQFPFSLNNALPSAGATPCNSVALALPSYSAIAGEDGSLGAGYLPHFRWTFDYPRRQLWLEPKRWRPTPGSHAAKLGFMRNARGEKGAGLPRISLTVDDQELDLLLDTGATAFPTPAGIKATGLQVEHGVGVTSYIATQVIDRWHRRHPDWRVVEDGDEHGGFKSRLIEVPKLVIAGWTVGPVWFTERPAAAFVGASGGVSMYMDRPVVGSAGANILSGFVMSLDYPSDTAWFACPADCSAIGKK